jgi:alkylation response protein AidB-like acyl-CoA dehydrogenase
MDFSFTEDQDSVRELVRQIFEDRCSHERSRELENSGVWFDQDLWQELVKSHLAGITVPEEFGGMGFGIMEACLVLEEVGRHCAPVPFLSTLILGGMPLAEFGSEAQCKKWLVPAAESGAVLTAALAEVGSSNPARPRVKATLDGDGWVLEGEKIGVPAASMASVILVPAATGDGQCGVFLVEPGADGVELEEQKRINWEPTGALRLSGVRVGPDGVLGDPTAGQAMVEWIVDRAQLGITATLLGVSHEALRRTAEYLGERQQFGRPLGTFQAVQSRCADAYIDIEAMRGVLWQAAWRISEGRRSGAEVRVAKWWAARAGDRVVHSAQHLHGGIGSDVDYPIHRFFLWAQELATCLGGAGQQLSELGALLTSDDQRPTA